MSTLDERIKREKEKLEELKRRKKVADARELKRKWRSKKRATR